MEANVAYKLSAMDGSDKALTHLSLKIAGKPDAVTACGKLIGGDWMIDFNDIDVTCPTCLKWSGAETPSEPVPEKGTKEYTAAMVERLVDATELYIDSLESEVEESKENVDWDALDEIEYYKEAVTELLLKLHP